MSQLDHEQIYKVLLRGLGKRLEVVAEQIMEIVEADRKAMREELTKEREASFKKDAALEWYAIPYNYTKDHLDKYGYIPIDKDGGKQAREALGKSEKDYETAGECAWCDEISSELRHPHMFDRADNGGKMCRICWNMDRETYKGSYDVDIGPFDEEVILEGNEPNEG